MWFNYYEQLTLTFQDNSINCKVITDTRGTSSCTTSICGHRKTKHARDGAQPSSQKLNNEKSNFIVNSYEKPFNNFVHFNNFNRCFSFFYYIIFDWTVICYFDWKVFETGSRKCSFNREYSTNLYAFSNINVNVSFVKFDREAPDKVAPFDCISNCLEIKRDGSNGIRQKL